MKLHLTDMSVRALKGGESNPKYFDTKTPGFGIRCGVKRKTWVVMRGKDRELITIGRYPDLALIDARKEAKKLLSSEPEKRSETLTFGAAKDVFLEENYKDRSLRAKSEATRLLNKHFKKLHPMPLPDIDDTHISARLSKLAHTPSEQLHAYRVVRCFLRWCTRPPRRYIKHSPMEGYEPPGKDRKGTRTLTDAEMKAVWKVAESPPYDIVRILILWGTRNTETASLRRSWSEEGVMTIPGSHTKNGRDHAIPILPLASSVLSASNGEHYFGSRWGTGHLSDGAWGKIKREIQAASGTKNWTMRDIRRTFRSNIARLKVPREVAEVLINHAPETLDEIYDRYDRLEEKRDALAKYETWLQIVLKN